MYPVADSIAAELIHQVLVNKKADEQSVKVVFGYGWFFLKMVLPNSGCPLLDTRFEPDVHENR